MKQALRSTILLVRPIARRGVGLFLLVAASIGSGWCAPASAGATDGRTPHGASTSVDGNSNVEQQAAKLYQTFGPIGIGYDMPSNGGATLVIEKPDGTRVRNLISDYPRKAGRNTDYWDGTDDNGHLVEAGQYQVRGLCHEPIDVLYDFAYGNPGNPPYLNNIGTGGWLSNHENPFGLAADDRRIYVSAPMSEGACSVLAADYNGQKVYGIDSGNAGLLVQHGEFLYMLMGGYAHQWFLSKTEVKLARYNAATGRIAHFGDGQETHRIATIPELSQWPGFKPRGEDGGPVARYDADWCQRQTMGFACAGGKLYASLFYQNQVLVIDPDKGATLGQIPLERPAGLVGDPSGALYAISGRRVLKLNAEQKWDEVVTNGLSAPIGLACDSQDNLYVSDWGEAMCVKVFSPGGKLLRTVGKAGGRSLSGPYDVLGMYRPWSMAIDASNRLWVAEYDLSPRRVSVWNASTGEFLREICGTTFYAGAGTAVNPLNPNQAFVLGNSCELDFAKGLWRVTGTLFRPTDPQAIFSIVRTITDVRRINGRDLLIANDGDFWCVAELKGDSARPLAAAGSVFSLRSESGAFPELVARHLWDAPGDLAWAKKKWPAIFNGIGLDLVRVQWDISHEPAPGGKFIRPYFLWTDQNGDGLVQEPEIKFYRADELGGMGIASAGWRWGYGPDLTLYLPGGKSEGGKQYQTLWKLPVREWNAAGAPVYDVKAATMLASVQVGGFPDSSSWTSLRGETLIGQNPMMMFSTEGKLLWTYPNPWPGVHGSHTAASPRRGRIIGPLFVLGSAEVEGLGEVFCIAGNLGERYLMTCDGLYIAGLFRDSRAAPDVLPDMPLRGMSLKSCSAGGESFGGQFFQHPKTRNYYVAGPVDSCREATLLGQVTGLDGVRRLPTQPLALSPENRAAAQKFLLDQTAPREAANKVLRIAKARQPVKDAPPEGVFDLSDKRLVRWNFDLDHSAGATWAYDSRNLYLFFRVQDDTPMINSGSDAQTLFKSGDAVEFELRTTANNDATTVMEGDFRLLISVLDQKPVAVLYRYKVAGTANPVEFSSPVGITKVDSVQVLSTANIAIDRRADGYNIRATIPLDALHFMPTAGQTYRGDFGVVYSDKAGRIDQLRMYWANPVNAMVNDLFSESQIIPAAWGRFMVEE